MWPRGAVKKGFGWNQVSAVSQPPLAAWAEVGSTNTRRATLSSEVCAVHHEAYREDRSPWQKS